MTRLCGSKTTIAILAGLSWGLETTAAAQSPDTFFGMGMSRYSPLPYAIGSTISIKSGGAASPNSEFELRSIAPFTP